MARRVPVHRTRRAHEHEPGAVITADSRNAAQVQFAQAWHRRQFIGRGHVAGRVCGNCVFLDAKTLELVRPGGLGRIDEVLRAQLLPAVVVFEHRELVLEGAVEREPRSERAEEAVGFEDHDLRMLLAQRAQQQGAGEREYLSARAAYVGGDALFAPKLQGRDGAKRLGVSQNEDVDAVARLAEHTVGLGIALTEFGLVVLRLHDT